jgi:hypothetical protein
MNTRNTSFTKDKVFESNVPPVEPEVNHHNKVVLSYDVYDSYPEKQQMEKTHQEKFQNNTDLPLGEEYRLHTPIEHHNHSKYRDLDAMAAVNEEINNLVVKVDFQ